MPEPALELRDLSVRYGAVEAVRRLSLVAERGEVVGLIGPNGAGGRRRSRGAGSRSSPKGGASSPT